MTNTQTSALAAVALALFSPSSTSATKSTDVEKQAISRCLVSEAGWDSPDDYSAILSTLAYRKTLPYWRPRPMLDLVRAYCQVLRYPHRTGGWIMNWSLGEPTERPVGFPERLNFRNYVDNWVRVQNTVERFQRGEVPHACNKTPHQWGAPSLRRPQWERLNCGRTQNIFYSEH